MFGENSAPVALGSGVSGPEDGRRIRLKVDLCSVHVGFWILNHDSRIPWKFSTVT